MPADRTGRGDHAGGRDQQCDAVPPDVGGHRGALAVLGKDLDAPGVHCDVLAGGEEGDQGGEREGEERQAAGIGQRQQCGGGGECRLDRGEPAAAAAEVAQRAGGGALSRTGAHRNFSE